MSKYGHRSVDWFEAIVNKLGGERGAESFLRGETIVSEPIKRWYEHDGVLYLTVVARGTIGERWIERLHNAGKRFGDEVGAHARNVLLSRDFTVSEVGLYEIAILKGLLFTNDERYDLKIRDRASAMGFSRPNMDIGCLLREQFTDKDLEAMGLGYVIVLHQPIEGSDDYVRFLTPSRLDGGNWLFACPCRAVDRIGRDCGFAFVVRKLQ